jgi:hypothetical protein
MSDEHQHDTAEGDAAFVVIEKGVGAPLALDHRKQAAELTHVLSRFDDEEGLAFARRVIGRLRRVRRAGLKIRSVSYVVPDRVSPRSRRKNRLLATLVRALEPGARVTLIASYLSAGSALGWSQSLRAAARPGVTCDIVWQPVGSEPALGA